MVLSQTALRPERAEDESFLRALYASTRAEEMALFAWPEPQRDMFLRMQFDWQRRHYRGQYPHADWMIVMQGECPIGRFYVERGEQAICVIDISLSPEYRSRGVGGALLERLLREAAREVKPVRLQVERHNRVLNLYRRLGFELREDRDVYLCLEAKPQR